MQAGPTDTPNHCTVCNKVTLHRPSPDGALHCMTCLSGDAKPIIVRDIGNQGAPVAPWREHVYMWLGTGLILLIVLGGIAMCT